jgi:hypothetical protein
LLTGCSNLRVSLEVIFILVLLVCHMTSGGPVSSRLVFSWLDCLEL